jgi:hypothetical protein
MDSGCTTAYRTEESIWLTSIIPNVFAYSSNGGCAYESQYVWGVIDSGSNIYVVKKENRKIVSVTEIW